MIVKENLHEEAALSYKLEDKGLASYGLPMPNLAMSEHQETHKEKGNARVSTPIPPILSDFNFLFNKFIFKFLHLRLVGWEWDKSGNSSIFLKKKTVLR
jgi:hypothetical protein